MPGACTECGGELKLQKQTELGREIFICASCGKKFISSISQLGEKFHCDRQDISNVFDALVTHIFETIDRESKRNLLVETVGGLSAFAHAHEERLGVDELCKEYYLALMRKAQVDPDVKAFFGELSSTK